MDLAREIASFRGTALLVSITRSGSPSNGVARLAAAMGSAGAGAEVRSLTYPLAAQFGQFHFHTVQGGRGKRDVQLELNEQIASATSSWAEETLGADRLSADRTS